MIWILLVVIAFAAIGGVGVVLRWRRRYRIRKPAHPQLEILRTESSAVLDSYVGFELQFPDGRIVRVQPLDVATTLYLLDLRTRGTRKALQKSVREFATFAGLEGERLYFQEWMEVMDGFFAFSRRKTTTPPAMRATPETERPTTTRTGSD